MKKDLCYIASIVLLMGLIASCKKTTPPSFHFEYFGMDEGKYVIYDVVEITHDKALEQHDTIYYQLKTKWAETYIDNEGRLAREFHRFTRQNASEDWKFKDVWNGIIDGIRAELTEENQRIVKLVFSPTYEKEWNSNAYNQDGELKCYYRNIHNDTVINGKSLDSTLVVEYDTDSNPLYDVKNYEMYAKNIGLVYKHYKNNHHQPLPGGIVPNPEPEKGYELYYTYVSSGVE